MADEIALTDEQRWEKLYLLYDALLVALLEAVSGEEPPSASIMNVARQFLAQNNVNLSTRPDLRRGLQSLADLRNLPFKV